MSEEEQMYEFNPEYEEESSTDSKPSIPPISSFTKGSGNGAEAFPTGLYNSKDNTHSMANLESNNNDSSNTDSSSESMSVASPSQQTLSQQPQETQQQPAQHQQLLPQPQAYNPAATDFPYANQVLVTSSSQQETNGVLPSHVIHSGPLPTAMAPAGMPLQGHTVIPFMASSSSTSGPTQTGIISSGGPEQMIQYSTSAMHLLTSTAQPVYSMPAPGQTSASIIHVNDAVPVQPTVLPHNIDLQHHLQHQQQLQQQHHPPKNGSAEKEDQNDDSRKISLATLVSHAQMQPPVQAGSNPRPGLPPHLMQLNPPAQTMSPLGGPVPQHFVPGPGPIPIQGSIATGNYGNAQVLPPQPQQQQQQVPTSVVCMPPHMGPPPHGMVEQPNPMIGAGPGPGGIGMPDGVEDSQQSPGSSGARRNNKRRGNKRDVPNDEKDSRYYERRDRNNKAAKRSRDARKIREEQVGMRAHYLEKENDFLRAQLNTLREEANSLRLLLAQRPPVNQMQPTGQPPMQ